VAAARVPAPADVHRRPVLHLWLVHRRTPAGDPPARTSTASVSPWAGRCGPTPRCGSRCSAPLATVVVVASAALVPWTDVGLEGPFRPAEATNTLHPAVVRCSSCPGGCGSCRRSTSSSGRSRITNMFVAGVALPGLLIGALVVYPFFERWWLRRRHRAPRAGQPLDLPMRAGVTAVLTSVLLVLTLAAGVDVISFWLRVPVEGVIWAFRIALVALPVLAALVAVARTRRRPVTDT
jgi:hypothetical protein